MAGERWPQRLPAAERSAEMRRVAAAHTRAAQARRAERITAEVTEHAALLTPEQRDRITAALADGEGG